MKAKKREIRKKEQKSCYGLIVNSLQVDVWRCIQEIRQHKSVNMFI